MEESRYNFNHFKGLYRQFFDREQKDVESLKEVDPDTLVRDWFVENVCDGSLQWEFKNIVRQQS